jgi:hypothetical protein
VATAGEEITRNQDQNHNKNNKKGNHYDQEIDT